MGNDRNSNNGHRATLFVAMANIGNVLIDAQRLEESAGNLYRSHPTPEGLERWKAVRQTVEERAGEYLTAVRRWREATEIEIVETPPKSAPLWQKAS